MRAMLLILLLFVSCEKPDDVTQIQAMLDDVISRAQAHDINGMMAHVTRDYVASPGTRDEQSVRPILMLALRSYGKFRIEHPAPSITVDSNGATAEVSLTFLVVREGQQFPAAEVAEITNDPVAWAAKVAETLGDPYKIDLKLRKEPDGWMIRQSDISGFKNVHDL